jgi:hypothetical protein
MNMATLSLRLALIPALLLGAMILIPSPSFAQRNKDASIGFILQQSGSVPRCNTLTKMACSDPNAKVTGALEDYYVILCVFNGDPELGIAGMEFGIDYDPGSQSGVDITSWSLCADLEWMDDGWPDAGSGGLMTWVGTENCQKTVPGDDVDGVTAIAGFLTVTAYSTDQLKIIPHHSPNGGQLFKVADCDASESSLNPNEQAGWVGFSSDLSEKGSIPCVHHVGKTTWGTIKNTYGH